MKDFIRKRFCKTTEETTNAINDFNETLTKEKCQNYIRKLRKVIEIVIENNGDWSGC
jgi:hypothetical protein